MNSRQKSILQLLSAALIWGLSFTLVRWSLESFSTSQILFWRFFLGYFIGEIILYFINPTEFKISKSDFKLARSTGLMLGLSLLFQIHGLNFTTATNSGFITATYVVLIPFISLLVLKQKISWVNIALGLLAMIGITFLLNMWEANSIQDFKFNKGDILTIFSAITAAFQIIYIGIKAKTCKSSFRFNNFQTFWAFVATAPFLIYENYTQSIGLIPDKISSLSLLSLIGLILGVTILAFYLQINAQKHLSTATSSMLCLLEAPFSFIFAALLIGEQINLVQGFGAALIILSAFLAVYSESKIAPIE